MKADAIIVAAGSGRRFSGDTPKQLTPILGRPMIAWAVEPFFKSEAVTSITVVTVPGDGERIRPRVGGDRTALGRTRQDGFRLGRGWGDRWCCGLRWGCRLFLGRAGAQERAESGQSAESFGDETGH